MNWLSPFLFRLRSLFRRRQIEEDIAEEMRLHLELRQERNAAAGMSPAEAEIEARRSFGGVEQLKERVRDEHRWVWVEQGMQDVRYALRSLRQAPGFFVVALVTLALGIGVNAMMFSIVRDHYLRPLVRDERLNLVAVYNGSETPGRSYRFFSFNEYETIRAERELFSDVAAMGYATLAVGDPGNTKRSLISFVSENFFSLLHVAPAAGRFFTVEEARPNANRLVVVASHAYWRRIGQPRDFIGSILKINGFDFTVIGLAPEGFGGLHNSITPEVWIPSGAVSQLAGFMGTGETRDLLHPRSFRFALIATLAPGVTLAAAPARLTGLINRLNESVAAGERRRLLVARPSRYNIPSTEPDDAGLAAFSQRSTLIALGVAAAVMLVASLNVANLLLARGANRRKEFAVRLSLGASRGRVVRQLLTEGLVLGLSAAVVGVLICEWSGTMLQRWTVEVFGSGVFAFNAQRPVDSSVLGFTVVMTLLATLAFSLAPALRSTRIDLVDDLKRQPGAGAAGGAWSRFFSLGHSLVMAQIAVAVALLFGAGLFLRAARAAGDLEKGFRAESRLVANIDFDFGRTPVADVPRHQQAILARARQLPGVVRAALSSAVPYNFERSGRGVFAVGGRGGEPPTSQFSIYTAVTPEYFQTMGITLLRGRDFTATEGSTDPSRPVAVIDETLARRLFGEAEAVGRQIVTNRADIAGQNPKALIEIVGVVRSPREDVFETDAPPRLYRPLGQVGATNTYLTVELAPGVGQSAMIERLRSELRALEPDNAVLLVRPLGDFPRRNINTASVEFGAVLVGSCAAVAFVLAVVGVYSVKAYAVARRTKELGIRLALGARPAAVYRLVMGQGALQTAVGVAAGLVLALLTGRAAASLLYRIDPNDWLLLLGVSAVLSVAALLACLLPARRATKVDPMVALRCE